MIYNITKKKRLACKPIYARGIFMRGRGMIGRDFSDFDAMVFEDCNSIHTMFMGINLDVLFVDRENKICALKRGLKPWTPLVKCATAFLTIELPEHVIELTGSEIGDAIDLMAELTKSEIEKAAEEELIQSAETAITFSEKD